ncbi:MAG: helix-hairpin-helix domain-containing protein [Sporocytophaga sp.]|uniref:helix-hairpin-helix domain-containing protein n=1 Tax=Sporocytophaga sp. TaxID=2231183 RepID=UPI001B26C96A|nr:helix-hairpin-helix domain-containing protein [Sporocytophaga sp.]MBO9701688.1 helix-hairpin-helix domain-containing protein [Sporocytophaga sp.]
MNLIERCKSFFGISRKEAQGFIVLQGILGFVLIAPFFTDFIFPQKNIEKSESNTSLDSLVKLFEVKEESFTHKNESAYIPADKLPGNFDPNTASKETLLSTGLKPKLAERIIKFRAKGGKFFVKEDLLKIYGLDKNEFVKIAPFLTFQTPSKSKLNEKKVPELFDINKADSVNLEKLNGIGPALAKRILKYRNALGGFISKDQYAEIYGLTENALAQLNAHTFIDKTFEPVKINLHDAEFKTIAGHPYLGYQAAKCMSKLKKTTFSAESIHSIILNDTVFKCRKLALLYRYIEVGQ